MAKYYSVLVAVEVEDAKGKVKKNKENYSKIMVGKLLIALNPHITNHRHYVIHQHGYQ
jgi:hypothetical protein